jgi:hypothetical protein
MPTLIEQIETMRIRMNAMAAEEYGLVRTLDDDEHLFDEEASAAPRDGRNHATPSRLGQLAGSLSRPFSLGVSRVFWASRQK